MTQEDTQQFWSRLTACFPPVKLPATIIYDGSAERAAVDLEVQELCELMDGKSWSELNDREVRILVEYLSLMSPEAFVAYMPAFLRTGMKDLEDGDEGIPSIVVSMLSPKNESGNANAFVLERVKLFGDEQARLIAEWLAEIAGRNISTFLANDINRAVSSYWAQWNSARK